MRNLNAPNLLTFCRLLLTPAAAWTILTARYREALGVFAIAAITDALDGLLARQLHSATRLGAYLDPIADKTLLVCVYLVLGVAGLVPWWLVAIVLGRDVLILAMVGAALLFTRYREFPPSVWGKISTVFQMLAAVLIITGQAFPAWGVPTRPLVWMVAAATIWSGAAYLCRGLSMARRALSAPR